MVQSDSPRALGKYVLDEHIATGTTATIWRGHDSRTGRQVAIKRFHQHLLADRSARKRMEHEAKAARAVRAPTIVSAIDTVTRRDEFALVFPYVTGSTLAERLRDPSGMAPAEAAAIAADVADALVAIHRHSLVHRDVKPANVLLRGDGRAVLLDFGISQAVSDDIALDQALTGAGLAIGTLPYMAPEQISAQPLSAETDVYALGVVLYEMLAGTRPYEATSPVTLAVEQRIAPARIADAPEPLVDLAMRALSFSPSARPTAAQFSVALRSWMSAPLAADALTAQIAAVPLATAPAPLARTPRHRTMWATAALAVAALAVIAFVALAAAPGAAPPGNDPTNAPIAAAALPPTPSPTPSATPAPVAVAPAIAPAGPVATPPPATATPPPPESRQPNNHTPKHHGHHKPPKHKKHHH